ncbi:ImmA/IrrE family metallo-endopeptidase [Desertivirga xinjiangensis]|uniref:ImmA/IrrE family metallo-endopeptidase n=1 Tax=Desertivirga xinjiangensis TaxID=539206 RepID=UPI00210DFA52|nr:ImmA/IrrE family metallo-endopeptidase [Pedobacter xinjiangensis]
MNTTLKGELFEQRAYDIIQKSIAEGNFGLMPETCRVLRKPRYYSSDREGDIIFDQSIEVWPKGAERCHLLYLVECKDYSGDVPVNDVEEFVSKIRQVAGEYVKGVFVTTGRMQKAGLNILKNRRFMFIQIDRGDKANIVLHNKKRGKSLLTDTAPVVSWTDQATRLAEIRDLLQREELGSDDWDRLIEHHLTSQLNARVYWEQPGKEIAGLEYLSKSLIEDMTQNIINEFDGSILYHGNPLPLERFMVYLTEKYGLRFIVDEPLPENKRHLNGYYDREAKCIYIDQSLRDTGQFAFVCAHEIGHFFLHENLVLSQQLYDAQADSTYNKETRKYALKNEKHWLEWQANQFGAALIMPRRSLLAQLICWQIEHGIRNKGTMFLDYQEQNILDFKKVITLLAYKFEVSRTILEYRMRDLEIIKYKNRQGYNAYSLFGNLREPQALSKILNRIF